MNAPGVGAEVRLGDRARAIAREHVDLERPLWSRQPRRGRWSRVPGTGRRVVDVATRADRCTSTLNRLLKSVDAGDLRLHADAEWLADNDYRILSAVDEAKRELTVGFVRTLPKAADGGTFVEALAREYLDVRSGALDVASLVQFVRAYSTVRAPTLGETWALPGHLRLIASERIVAAARERWPSDSSVERVPIAASLEVVRGIAALRAVDEADWSAFVASVSVIDDVFRDDVDDVYARMDASTKDRYRAAVERLARGGGCSEGDVAAAALDMARRAADEPDATHDVVHVGWWLIGGGREALERRLGVKPSVPERVRRSLERAPRTVLATQAALYTCLLTIITFASAQPLVGRWSAAVLTATLWIPFWSWSEEVARRVVTHVLPPRRLPRLDPDRGVPGGAATLVVVPALVTTEEDVDALLGRLERHYLAGPDPRLSYALATDFPDATTATSGRDDVLRQRLRAGMQHLRSRHPRATFAWLHRRRVFDASEGRWMGWERKRGKLVELVRLIVHGWTGRFEVDATDVDVLREVSFVLTLDADNVLAKGAAATLACTMAHPLVRPVVRSRSSHGRVVERGYAILQPRTSVVPERDATRYAKIEARDGGRDLYGRAVSNAYMDLFAEAPFTGKGLLHAAAFEAAIADRIPADTVLSHDLLEGGIARAALANEVEVLEHPPSTLAADLERTERWTRGDWQLFPWAGRLVPSERGPVPNPLSPAVRWIMVHAWIRSLVEPATLLAWWSGLALVGGADATSPLFAWTWTGTFALVAHLPTWSAVPWLARRPRRLDRHRGFAGATTTGIGSGEWARATVTSFAYPRLAWTHASAVGRTLWRIAVSGRHLLRWRDAASADRLHVVDGTIDRAWARSWPNVVAGSIGVGLAAGAGPWAVAAAMVVAGPWLALPWLEVAWSRVPRPTPGPLDHDDRRWLRTIARRTWAYFETFAGPADHWLPPDHVQTVPVQTVAHRTSPTNVGMGVVAAVAAYDLGFVGARTWVTRVSNVLSTVARLERHRGHLLNWYDTRTLAPLAPRYVSTVDSGNLHAAWVVARTALDGVLDEPVLRPEESEGLVVTIDLLAEATAKLPRHGDEVERRLAALRRTATHLLQGPDRGDGALDAFLATDLPWLEEAVSTGMGLAKGDTAPDAVHDVVVWLGRLRDHLTSLVRERDTFMPWRSQSRRAVAAHPLAASIPPMPTFRELDGAYVVCDAILADESFAEVDRDAFAAALEHARESLHGFQRMVHGARRQLDQELDDVEVDFLYDDARDLFRLGHHVDDDRSDPHAYDLFASEARLASYLAIAWDRVPVRHWVTLGRPFAATPSGRVLLSWSGTMFEYLLPAAFLRTEPSSLSHVAIHGALDRQRAAGRVWNAPWGVSESSYASGDPRSGYPYRAFGVPDLALARTGIDRRVVAPYASAMALPFLPSEATRNLRRLANAGMVGSFGFLEAWDLDASPSRSDGHRVHVHMAHHHGMTLMGIVNVLLESRFVERFHADPRIRACDVLLGEGVGEAPLVERAPVVRREIRTGDGSSVRSKEPWDIPDDASGPRLRVLGNGRMTRWTVDDGSGGVTWEEVDLTRRRRTVTEVGPGTDLLVRRHGDDAPWSLTRPHPRDARSGRRGTTVTCLPHATTVSRRDDHLSSHVETFVHPDLDVDVQVVTLTHHGDAPTFVRTWSVMEPVLAPHADDLRHTAFGRLFLEASWHPELDAAVVRRRPRTVEERPARLAHAFVAGPGFVPSAAPWDPSGDGRLVACFARDRWTGRVAPGTATGAASGELERGEDVTPRAPIDPVVALSAGVSLPPHQPVQFAWCTWAGRSGTELLEAIASSRSWSWIEEARGRARSHADRRLDEERIGARELRLDQMIASLAFHPSDEGRDAPEVLAARRGSVEDLWRYGVSGDLPIVVHRVVTGRDVAWIPRLLASQERLRRAGARIDLVLLNERDVGYASTTQERVRRHIADADAEPWIGRPGGVHPLVAAPMPQDDVITVRAVASMVVGAGREPGSVDPSARGRALPVSIPIDHQPPTHGAEDVARPASLLFDNGVGGFAPSGTAYHVYLPGHDRPDPSAGTPAPWINVLANPTFGCLASESSLGTTWVENSGEYRLTPWSNDALTPHVGEAVYLRDEASTAVWSVTPQPAPAGRSILVTHGLGYTRYRQRSHDVDQTATVFVDDAAQLKYVHLRLRDLRGRPRRLTVTYYAEWILGTDAESSSGSVIPSFDAEHQVVFAHNPHARRFAHWTAFLAADRSVHGLTCDRTEFLGRYGTASAPAGLARIGLSGRVDAGPDPCAALQVHVDLPAMGVDTVTFLLGAATSRDEAVERVRDGRDARQRQRAWWRVRRAWHARTSDVRVRTPDEATNVALAGWWTYQALACRLWGRTATYQSSGAFGFRDQLQDALAIVHVEPAVARDRILDAAAAQFVEGDVLHWWHPPDGRGVRTRISDDLAWLPYVAIRYVRATGDDDLLDQPVRFRTGAALTRREHERFDLFPPGDVSRPLLDHLIRAVDAACTEGPHGLPAFGGGDWNDGMNRVGVAGRGESVWLGWFLVVVLEDIADLLRRRGELDRADAYDLRRARYLAALEEHAWDGAWYLRGFFDDGSPLGSHASREARIDAIAQAWPAMSGAARPERVRSALDAAERWLIRPDDRLVQLLVPPFDVGDPDPGYVAAYVPGVRENGGQYTHGAAWLAIAFAATGDGDRAHATFDLLNPIQRTRDLESVWRYRVEPYVVTADVYAVAPHVGRGGWSWYTGSAAWMQRLGIEAILGIVREADVLKVRPVLPSTWPGYEATVRRGRARYDVKVVGPAGVEPGVHRAWLDGDRVDASAVPFVDDGRRHALTVEVGPSLQDA